MKQDQMLAFFSSIVRPTLFQTMHDNRYDMTGTSSGILRVNYFNNVVILCRLPLPEDLRDVPVLLPVIVTSFLS